ncbi:protein O-glucosyltransferase 2 isoform X2 [Hyalella azteca]|uniref:Protein O-glucosyltransferase 2 isoform X2 n=1 Tax=Hyalella azteca TaxID=294128 RepID=A0A8B7PE15_HYAAZ|nr:protein O-glucosyltransferase 2 isoform X2 [Hyalella azteca]
MILNHLKIILLSCLIVVKCLDVDPAKTKVFGLGLHPEKAVYPVRYFFIEAYDSAGIRLNHSVGEKAFSVQVEGDVDSGTYCRVWVQVLDRYDGSYIVRYRTYQTCHNMRINVLYLSQHVSDSPYKISEPVYPESCYCPEGTLEEWLTVAGCPASVPQVEEDLAPFPAVHFSEVLREAKDRYYRPAARSFCHYVVKTNEIYRHCYGQHVDFKMFMDNMLLSMARKMVLPDTEFIINLGDWPLVEKKLPPIPVFSWCGSDDTADIVLPTYDITETTLEMMGRHDHNTCHLFGCSELVTPLSPLVLWDSPIEAAGLLARWGERVTLDMLSVQSNNAVPWSKKKPIAFWRGRDSRQERLDLISLARDHPDLFNVSLTNFFFFRDQEEQYGPKQKHVSFFEFFNYKYQINIDGTVAAYRLGYLLGGTGVVLKQDSSYYEHFYKQLKPNVHYLPFKRDLSDLVQKIEWARANDDAVLAMSKAGRQFVLENLMPKDIFCYHAVLLQKWSQRLTEKVVIRPGMDHVAREDNEKRFGSCQCHRLLGHDEL